MLTLGTLTLTGVWLLAGHALAFLVGIFTSQYIKDTLKGMPSQLRTALNAHEKTSLASLKDAETKAINDTMTKLGIALPAAKPAAAVKPAAPAVGADVLAALKSAAKAIEDTAAKLSAPAPVAPAPAAPAAPATGSTAAPTSEKATAPASGTSA